MTRLRALLRLGRPKQWLKNSLVYAAPAARGAFDDPHLVVRTTLAALGFVLVSAACYAINDVADVDADRQHPEKRSRPVASGAISERLATTVGVIWGIAGFALGLAAGWRVLVILVVYATLTISYSVALKRIAIVDIAIVASGFVLRAVAGGLAARVHPSQWFIIVAGAGALFMVAGKRHGELLAVERSGVSSREVLAEYSVPFLRYVWGLASAVAMSAYCLWAFEQNSSTGVPLLFQLSIVPFAMATLRYAQLLDRGGGEEPELVVLGDRALQVFAVLWVASFVVGVYAA